MAEYLIRLYPLEPYTFGQEIGLQYDGEPSRDGLSYQMNSNDVPDQSTLFGVTRYLILYEQNVLRTDLDYKDSERQRIAEYVGRESFTFKNTRKVPHAYGALNGISPLFLMNSKDEVLVTNPFHNKNGVTHSKEQGEGHGFDAIRMSAMPYVTSMGIIHLPRSGEYIAKNGHATGYYNLTTGAIRADLFEHQTMVGNLTRTRKGGYESKRSYQMEQVILRNGYSFCYLADSDLPLPAYAIVYMGKRKNVFRAECCLASNSWVYSEVELQKSIRQAFLTPDTKWYYAWSDIRVEDIDDHDAAVESDYSMLEIRSLRGLYTNVDQLRQVLKNDSQQNCIQRGSVYYRVRPRITEDSNAAVIGLNRMIEL